ncbi:hypothetical protein LMIY3S_00296 [Labrys miyagiensis]
MLGIFLDDSQALFLGVQAGRTRPVGDGGISMIAYSLTRPAQVIDGYPPHCN